MNDTSKKSRVGIQDIISRMKEHPQAERIEQLTNKDIHNTINILWDSIVESIKDGEKVVVFQEHFTFTTKEVEAEEAKKVRSFGKEIEVDAIPAHRKIVVKVSPKLKREFKEETSK